MLSEATFKAYRTGVEHCCGQRAADFDLVCGSWGCSGVLPLLAEIDRLRAVLVERELEHYRQALASTPQKVRTP